MRLLLFILLSFTSTAQQLVTLCNGQSQTFFYSAEADEPGTTEWQVDNQYYYYGNPIALTWSDTGVYTITATHYALNCPSNTVSYTVTVKQCDPILYWVPNTFSPDGDESNQTWGPVFTSGFNPYEFRLFVVNRWGETVWESYDATATWDGTYAGKACQDGVYTWMIWFGDKYTDAKYIAHGHVTIVK